MAIPEFDEFGLLPEGTYAVCCQDIQDRYCDNPNRRVIWEKFLQFYAGEIQPLGWSNIVLVDGGFTSDKPHTKDIDVVLDISASAPEVALQVFIWQSTNYDRIKATYQTDFWIYHPIVPNDLRVYFTYIKEAERIQRGAPGGHKKGLLRLKL